jgi:hypothetical protein
MRAATYRAIGRGTPAPSTTASFEELLEQVAQSRLIITDTYHLAINAWRLGTPAICVVDRPKNIWSVNSGGAGVRRDKREELYSQLECTGLLVDGDDLPRKIDSVVTPLIDYVTDDRLLSVTHDRISTLAAQSRGWVVNTLNTLLGPSEAPADLVNAVLA